MSSLGYYQPWELSFFVRKMTEGEKFKNKPIFLSLPPSCLAATHLPRQREARPNCYKFATNGGKTYYGAYTSVKKIKVK